MQRLAMLALAASALVMASLCATASAHSASDGFLDVNSAGRQLLQTDDNPKKSDDDKLKCTGTVSVPVAKYEPAAFPPTYWTCTEDNSKTSYGCALLPRPCFCLLNFKPVCSADGKTFGNECQAKCANVKLYTEGACPTAAPTATTAAPTANCICTADFKPVCGADGRTYSNACRATCAKVTFTEGACPTAAPTATPTATPTAAPTGTGSDTKMPTAAPTPRKPQPPKCYQTKKALCCDAERSEVNKQYSKKDGYKCEKNGRKFRCCRPYEKVCFTKKFKRGSRKCCYDRSKKFKDNRKYTCFSDSHQGVKGEYCYKY